MVASILLDSGLGPATERVPIRKRWVHIVVGIPKRKNSVIIIIVNNRTVGGQLTTEANKRRQKIHP